MDTTFWTIVALLIAAAIGLFIGWLVWRWRRTPVKTTEWNGVRSRLAAETLRADEITADHEMVQASLAATTDDLERARGDLGATEAEREILRSELAATTQDLVDVRRALETTGRERTDLAAKLASTEARREELDAAMAAAVDEKDGLVAAVGAVETERDGIRAEYETATADLDRVTGERDGLRGEIQRLTREHASLHADVDRVTRERDALRADVDRLTRERASAVSDTETARDVTASLQAELDEARRRLAAGCGHDADLVELEQLRAQRDADLVDVTPASVGSSATSPTSGSPTEPVVDEDVIDLVAAEAAVREDDLRVINGIGPKMQSLLRGLGIRTWEQIADMDDDAVERVSALLETFPGRIARDGWVRQARELVAAFPDVSSRPTRATYLHESADPELSGLVRH